MENQLTPIDTTLLKWYTDKRESLLNAGAYIDKHEREDVFYQSILHEIIKCNKMIEFINSKNN